MNIKTGVYPDPQDFRDVPYEPTIGAAQLPSTYDLESEIGELKKEDQNGSLSCVAQAFSKYAEALEKIENGRFTDLSAKFIYSRIYLPQGGAYLRDGAKLLANLGDALEADDPSYPNTEQALKVASNSPATLERALMFRAKGYASIWHQGDPTLIKQAIFENKGVVTAVWGSNQGWGQALVRPPQAGEETWGHAIFFVGWTTYQGQECFIFINSWGESWGDKGRGYLPMSYLETGNVFSLWTIQDLPDNYREQTQMLQLVRAKGQTDVYAINGNKRHLVLNRQAFDRGVELGFWSGKIADWEPEQLAALQEGYVLVIPDSF